MQPFRSILVDIDALAAAHPALDRAADLARRCGARLKVVDVVALPSRPRPAVPDVEEAVVRARRDALARAAASLAGVKVDTAVLVGRPSHAIVQEVLRSGHDLVVRSHARDLVSHGRTYGAVDMQLFRQCPCPVWAVTPSIGAGRPLKIVAAVNANPDDDDEQKLNAKILEHALLMAGLQQGSLTVLQAWVAFGEELVRSRYSPEDLAGYVNAARVTAERDLGALLAPFGERLAGAAIELLKGDPEDVIPEFVVREGADIVVMGTVARTGIPGLLIGNTAERLLQKLVCSVLAVKPDGFVSPVRIDGT